MKYTHTHTHIHIIMLSIYMIFLFKINSSTSQTSNTEGLGNPTYDGLVHPITNMELPEAEATYSYSVMPQTHKYDTVTNITEERPRVNQDIPINTGIYSPAENIEIEGVAEDEIGTYSKLQRK